MCIRVENEFSFFYVLLHRIPMLGLELLTSNMMVRNSTSGNLGSGG